LRPILEKAGILHSLEASGYFGAERARTTMADGWTA
jgi:hypothetical protein